jgi:glycosyltransferase involved in cell wall biosynthesis
MKPTDSHTATRADLPFVSVIIPARNEERFVASCLESVIAGSYPHELIEILVVDGKSDDRTREIVQQFSARYGSIKLLDNPAAIVPNGMNIGIGVARGEVIVRMDAHALYPPDYIEQLVTGLLSLGADNVGGVCLARPASDRPQARAVALILSDRFGVGNSDHRVGGGDQPAEVDTVPFGCYRREVFDRIGSYDEMFVRNQDDELNSRLKIAGGRVFLLPHVKIEYFTRPSLRKMALMLYQYGYYKPLVAIKLGRPATWRQLAPPVFTAAVLGLPLAAVAFPWTLSLWAATIGAHCLVNLRVSSIQARREGWRLFPYLFCGYGVAHLSYGFGYLRGILDFGLLRRHLSKTKRNIPLSR